MRAAAPLVQRAYAGPVLVYSAMKAPRANRKYYPLQKKYAEDGNFFKGMLVALFLEAAGGAGLYFIWHIGHLLR